MYDTMEDINFSNLAIFFILILGCTKEVEVETQFIDRHESAGVLFNNELRYSEELNPYTFRNFFNGGGVAIGDVNNDGLLDVYFTGNLVDNKLFLNQGNWKFKDISASAGVSCPNVWSTGATFVDINADGFLDIYVCKSGPPGGDNRYNELFINNGDLTFTESASEYGLDIDGLSVQSAFFDYDKDGDLDCYLLTNSIRSVGNYDLVQGLREMPDPDGNKFFVNDKGKFKDASSKVGIYSSNIGFGLGITLSDFNEDGWVDMFVSNDFFERDYLYINDQNGGFTEELENYFLSISMGSMGADAADLNNDGHADLIVTEMLPDSLSRRKVKAIYENWDKHILNVSKGFYFQFPRNTLQRGFDNGFLEIGRFSGVAATEWSWGALIFDMNNDGLKDIFVSNGIYKDLLDRDYLNYMASDEQIRQMIRAKEDVITQLVNKMPSKPVPNYLFQNMGSFQFANKAQQLGLVEHSFSNGSAYGDLDNDGDLDLIVNNVNQPAFLYENRLDTSANRSLNLKFSSHGKNTFEIGSKVLAYAEGERFDSENYTIRGFQSSTAPVISLGIGNVCLIDSVKIVWPDLACSTLYNVPTNTQIEVKRRSSDTRCDFIAPVKEEGPFFKSSNVTLDFKHRENEFSEFNRERLLISMQSNEGPHLSVANLEKDTNDQIIVSGAKNQASQVFFGAKISNQLNLLLKKYKVSEDVDPLFFDADSDGDLDLYLARGGRAFSRSSSALQDILLLNTKEGFVEGERLPFSSFCSSSAVVHGDYDGDGDEDLFVGERSNPFIYGVGGRGYLFTNDGSGVFIDNSKLLPGIDSIGMVKDAEWQDFDNDNLMDLVVLGEWMGVHVFLNRGDFFENRSMELGLQHTRGLWNTLEIGDFDDNGYVDIAAGNLGLNNFLKPRGRLYVSDFDRNGSTEQILCEKLGDNYYPIHDKDELIAQLPGLRKKLFYYKDYSHMTIEEIFGEQLVESAAYYEIDMLQTTMFMNNGDGFSRKPFPKEIQYSPVYAIYSEDFNDDGISDFLLGGNQYNVKPQFGRYDASEGWLCLSMEDGLKYMNPKPLGVKGQIRDIKKAHINNKTVYIFGMNNDYPIVYEKSF